MKRPLLAGARGWGLQPRQGGRIRVPDLNLLITLDVLLREGSVAKAAKRLRLSPSAMSRTLARLRAATGDPLLVRAGRGLVPTPRAEALAAEVASLVEAATAALSPAATLDLATLSRTFTIRARDGFVETFGPALIARVAHAAPGVRLCFVPKPDKDSGGLRDGRIDLETGVLGDGMGPEIRMSPLFRDRFVGVVRHDHPLCEGAITRERYAAGLHVPVSRRGLERGPIDAALATDGLTRQIGAVVGGFSEALAVVRGSDLIATVPERVTVSGRANLFSFDLPIPLPALAISLFWHPRHQADLAHIWMRGCIVDVCR